MKVTLTKFESKRVEEYSRGLVSDTSAESTTMVEGTFEEVRDFLFPANQTVAIAQSLTSALSDPGAFEGFPGARAERF